MRGIMTTTMLTAALVLPAMPAFADTVVENAWARATAPGQANGSLQFTITTSQAANITAASSPVAEVTELHTMTHEGGRMKMRTIEAIELTAGEKTDISRNGNHVMLIKLKQPLSAGESIPFALTLKYADGKQETLEAKAEVRPVGSQHNQHGKHDMH